MMECAKVSNHAAKELIKLVAGGITCHYGSNGRSGRISEELDDIALPMNANDGADEMSASTLINRQAPSHQSA